MKPIIDICCGSKMFWFNKADERAVYCDKREETHTLCDGRTLTINPDMICDFTALPFADNSFYCVVFDPPHLVQLGKTSWMALKYGVLPNDWPRLITDGFAECFRILKPNGTLVFKWSETQIKVSEILKLTPYKPVVGHKSGRLNKTHWILFLKDEVQCG